MKKAVFFDIDGTLWDDKMQIPESTISAIRALRANGNYAFICTGRSRSNVADERLLGIGFDGVVAGCGTYFDLNDQVVYQELLTQEQLQKALKVLDRYKTHVVFEGPIYTYIDADAFPEDPYVIYLKKTLGDKVKEISRHPDAEHEVNKMSIGYDEKYGATIVEQLKDDFDAIVHHEGIAELVPIGFSKATGIQKVCEHLGIERKDTYAIGDSANDLEMLKYAGHGIAMGNGTKEAKEAADYVTTELWQDGIRNGLEYYGLI